MDKQKKSKKVHRQNMQNLRTKVYELKRIKQLAKPKSIFSKEEINIIKKSNKIPKGEKLISNQPGNIIDVENLTKIYATGKVLYSALKNVSFSIKKGEFVVIVGESGSGKTTLLNVISGLDRPTSGEIVIQNTNISALKSSELTTFRRNNIGFVFQSYNLLQELNAFDNAKLGQQLQTNATKRLDLEELFARVGLAKYQKKAIDELSGGQLQRVSIVRALAKNPAIIFADEPTGALDTSTSQKVIALFQEINKKYGTTIILVTHDRSITKVATKIIDVKDGNINVKTQ